MNEQGFRDLDAGDAALGILRSHTWPDNARLMHNAVAEVLRAEGFTVVTEYFVRGAFGYSNGRIDIVARRDGGHVAIELDARRPRERSVAKLNKVEAYRIIGLRGVDFPPPPGIDAIACMPVRGAA